MANKHLYFTNRNKNGFKFKVLSNPWEFPCLLRDLQNEKTMIVDSYMIATVKKLNKYIQYVNIEENAYKYGTLIK